MARMARSVVAGVAHHVTARGNRCQPTFFEEADYALYRDLLAERCRRHQVAVWAWCLMPNHVHLILVPTTPGGLAAAIGEAHQRYTTTTNRRHDWTGHLWQGRFASVALDAAHLIAATRYVELNPVRAGLAPTAADWPWSSACAHLAGRDDKLTSAAPLREAIGGWAAFLETPPREAELDALRRHERTGRPLGAPDFVRDLEDRLGRRLRPGKPGRRPAVAEAAERSEG